MTVDIGPHVTAQRMLSMQPAAVRKRLQRDRERQRLLSTSDVTSPAMSSSVTYPPHPQVADVPSPATAAVTPANDAPSSSSSSWASLHETEVVTGPGADAFARSTMLGVDDAGDGGTPLVDGPKPQPPRQTSPTEAAMIGKAVGLYVGFGWGLLATRHADKLIPLAELALQAHPELKKLPGEVKLQLGLAGAVAVVEKAAMEIALEKNIRIPYQNEGIVGVAFATATLGIVQEFRTPKPSNDNEDARDVTPPSPSPAPPARDKSRDNEPPRQTTPATPVDTDGLEAEVVRLEVKQWGAEPAPGVTP